MKGGESRRESGRVFKGNVVNARKLVIMTRNDVSSVCRNEACVKVQAVIVAVCMLYIAC